MNPTPGQITQGRAEDVMRGWPDGCVDFVLFDPPYNAGKDYGAAKDAWPSDGAYLMDATAWVMQAMRVAGGRVGLYAPKKYLREYWSLLPENRLTIMGWAPEGVQRDGVVHQYNAMLLPRRPVPGAYWKDHHWNVQASSLGFFCREEKTSHPGQSSLDMTERVILAFTRPGELVLDPFMGSGTTALACEKHGRRWVGVEENAPFIDMALERIERARRQPQLPLEAS